MRCFVYLLCTISLLTQFDVARASHLNGGEITFECLSSGADKGKMIFTYREFYSCNSGLPPSTKTIINPLYAVYGGPSTIVCTSTSWNELTPKCDTGSTTIYCQSFPPGPTSTLYREERVYVSSPVQINGVPSVTGSEFYLTQCCRPSSSELTNVIGGSNMFVRVTLFPYTDPVSGSVKSLGSSTTGPTCYDSSPRFAEKLRAFGYSDKLNFFTIKSLDPDCDSITYDNTVPLKASASWVTYKTGFSSSSPTKNTSFNSANIPFTLDFKTGNGYYKTISDTGNYVVAHKVTSYRFGQKLAEVYRDYIISIDNVATDTYSMNNNNPSISFKNNNEVNYTSTYSDTFNVGDLVHINIKAIDSDFLYGSTFQSVALKLIPDPAIDDVFNPFGCKLSSCAYLDTNSIFWNGSQFKYSSLVSADFKWQLNCDALKPCLNSENLDPDFKTYHFSVEAVDNLCPMPLNRIASFTITVRDSSRREADFKKVEFNDTISQISWAKHKAPVFTSYTIYRADSAHGPFVLLDSITNINDTTYADSTGFSNGISKFYRILSSPSPICSDVENTVSSIVLKAYDTSGYRSSLEWNRMYHGRTNFIKGYYRIEADTGSGWMLIDSLSEDPYTYPHGYTYKDTITTCAPSVDYRIRAFDLSNEVTYLSNIDSARYSYPITQVNKATCKNKPVLIGGILRDSSGVYLDIKQTYQGCDSFVEVLLTVHPVYNLWDSITICSGDSLKLYGHYQKVPGNYTRRYTTSKSCDSISNTALFTFSTNTKIGGDGRILRANAAGQTYQWIKCPNTIIPGATSKKYAPTENGLYAVIVTENGCSDTSACKEVIYAGVGDKLDATEINVFPNPANHSISFEFRDGIRENTTLSIYNTLGKLLESNHVTIPVWQVNTMDYSDGFYYFKIVSDKEIISTGSFMVSH